MRTKVFTFVSFALLAACASPAGSPSGQAVDASDCFRPAQIRSFDLIDAHTLAVEVTHTRHYALGTRTDLHELNGDYALAITSPSSRVCVGDPIGVEIHRARDPAQSWTVHTIARLPEPAQTPADTH